MERNRKNVILACLVATNFASTSIVAGENITYDPKNVGGTWTNPASTKLRSFKIETYSFSDSISPENANSKNNTINILSTDKRIGTVLGGLRGDNKGNTINISGKTTNINNVYGSLGFDNADVKSNVVNLYDGNIEGSIDGGTSTNMSSIQNTVNIYGGSIGKFIFGGSSLVKSSIFNTVNIYNGNMKKNIYAGYALNGKVATNNTVNILGNPTFSTTDTTIYGGWIFGGKNDYFTGNTINIASKGLFVSNIANFEFINFYLPKNIAPNDTVFTLTNRPNFSVSKLGVALANDNTSLNVGDRINLVKSNAGVIAPNDLSNHINDPKNILKLSTTSTTFSNIYSFDILSDTTSIYTVVKNKENNPQQKSILEAGASMTGMLNIASDSIDSVLAKGLEDSSTDSLPSVFASANGYDTRLKSGSHVDIKGVSTIVGVSKKINENYTHGMFIELGYGNYDSFNSFNNGDIHGKGDNKYYGFGYLGKLDNLAFDTYVEGSARVGKIKSNYKGYGFTTTELPQYDSNRIYYSTHLGGGKIIDINNISNLDIYAKAYYTRLNSDEIDVVGTKFKLNSSDSLRAKLGARYNYDINDNLIFYTGAAYEREFKGEAKGKNLTFGYELDAPSLKGNSSIAEIGVRYTKPDSKKERFSIDLSTQGSLG
ncbi:autotransporter outer membrane beta-barrel domain-containing protein [Campylobacter hyointestinalis]|uniref:autotransporter outer membrane beta-barrel domain-containing protein n=1 Tax=Campylobacter hyointestinalis TaxID=198 RepID=UPI000CE49DF7|nr:autotransporter outer membrane beta-barrel domain-containing protein [Campylobacter hyointestinalis]PPB71487.1 hypothetical protein CDQ79_08485 [Campylobacter hyointestinalis subsp. hyointestinalis]PPB74594.1 hypothetical protein CDQ80_07400 [Campylobacter hyointestinalis subsp. hyointestinalis]PPB76243.1 hypothetical protein CDQ81_07940 [Campylobacter hyointestinalis subsp. hyointestinalis]PPB77834.1 hypothetical protein CDQ82_06380 [Campylobacter hyointestinalis subsp. hyointestinalis]